MMTSKTISDGILRALATIIVVGLILYFLFQIQVVIIYLVVALILTLIGNPILNFFKRRLKFNNLFGTIATLFIFVSIIAGFIMMFVPLISAQSQSLSLLNTSEIEKNITQLIHQITVFLDSHNIDSAQMLKEANISSKVNFNFIPNFLNSILGTISSFGMG